MYISTVSRQCQYDATYSCMSFIKNHLLSQNM